MSENSVTREEAAALEIGQTEISRPMAWSLIVVFLASVFSVPLVQHVHEISQYRQGERTTPWPQVYDVFRRQSETHENTTNTDASMLDRILDGNARLLRNVNAYEDALEDESILNQSLRPAAQLLLTGLFGLGNEKAYCGRNGWLFYRPGVDYLTGPEFLDEKFVARRLASGNEWSPPPQPEPWKAIVDFHEALKLRGIQLVLMPVPVKPLIHPEMFSRRYARVESAPARTSLKLLSTRLQDKGVLVFDSTELLFTAARTAPQYLAADTHWRPEAMEAVARDLAAFLQANDLNLTQHSLDYSRRKTEVQNLGDIAVMLQLPAGQDLFPREAVTIQQVRAPDGSLWQADKDSEVLVLGDSFSNIYSLEGMGWGTSAGLVEQLSYFLKSPVDRICRNDSGAYATRQILSRELAQGTRRLDGKKVVVWQFAMRELTAGDWKLFDLTEPDSPLPTPRAGSESGLVLRGKVKAVASVPRPGTVPYKNCVTSVHLVDAKAVNGTIEETEFLVYTWGMKNNAWTPVTKLKPGDEVTMKFTSWNEVHKKYESYNRMELDDDQLLLLDPWWGEIVE